MKEKEKILYFFISVIFCCLSCFSQINEDSLLRAQGIKWTGLQNKETFAYGKPAFGPFTTLDVSKIDSPVVNKKTRVGTNSGIEFSGRKTTFDQTKTIDHNKTTWYHLWLSKGTDTIKAEFAVTVSTRKEKRTFLGFIFGKSGDDNNRDFFYNRNVEGTINTHPDSLQWDFYLSNYVDQRIGGGYFKNDRDSLLLKTYNTSGFSTEIILVDQNGNHVASVFFNTNKIEISIQKELNGFYQQAIAGLFAVIVSIKNQ